MGVGVLGDAEGVAWAAAAAVCHDAWAVEVVDGWTSAALQGTSFRVRTRNRVQQIFRRPWSAKNKKKRPFRNSSFEIIFDRCFRIRGENLVA